MIMDFIYTAGAFLDTQGHQTTSKKEMQNTK